MVLLAMLRYAAGDSNWAKEINTYESNTLKQLSV